VRIRDRCVTITDRSDTPRDCKRIERIDMSLNLRHFIQYMDQVKDKDWVDEHLIIDGVSDKFQKEIKDKIRDRLKEDINNKKQKG
tara:strand:- start:1145 stop:1399 length:255 start_codon:yes stop_codon:yes gene_type:complete